MNDIAMIGFFVGVILFVCSLLANHYDDTKDIDLTATAKDKEKEYEKFLEEQVKVLIPAYEESKFLEALLYYIHQEEKKGKGKAVHLEVGDYSVKIRIQPKSRYKEAYDVEIVYQNIGYLFLNDTAQVFACGTALFNQIGENYKMACHKINDKKEKRKYNYVTIDYQRPKKWYEK